MLVFPFNLYFAWGTSEPWDDPVSLADCIGLGQWRLEKQRFQGHAPLGLQSPWPLYQESPRQTKPKKGQFMNFTKPKKGQFMNFSQEHSGTKVRYVNRACFPKEKHQNSRKWAKFMNFLFCPFLWFGLLGQLLIIGFIRALQKSRKNKKRSRGLSGPVFTKG